MNLKLIGNILLNIANLKTVPLRQHRQGFRRQKFKDQVTHTHITQKLDKTDSVLNNVKLYKKKKQ